MTLTKVGGWYVDSEQPGKKWGSPEEHAYFTKKAPVPPTVQKTAGIHDDSIETHPAYGIIGASHVSSTGTRLAGSDFKHSGFVTIRIGRAKLYRGLSHDRWHKDHDIIEVSVSEAQWATFISTLNQGEGVPCTLDHVRGEDVIPAIGGRADRRAQFKAEASEDLSKAEAKIDEMLALVRAGKMRKTELESLLIQTKNMMSGGVNFVAKSFGEHVETTLAHAKVEIEAYMTGMVQRAGIQALSGQATISLAEPEDAKALEAGPPEVLDAEP